MKNIKKYETPTLDIITFSTEDILTTSVGFDGETDGLSDSDWQ